MHSKIWYTRKQLSENKQTQGHARVISKKQHPTASNSHQLPATPRNSQQFSATPSSSHKFPAMPTNSQQLQANSQHLPEMLGNSQHTLSNSQQLPAPPSNPKHLPINSQPFPPNSQQFQASPTLIPKNSQHISWCSLSYGIWLRCKKNRPANTTSM